MTTTKTTPTPQDLLLRAADIIGERGWTQGDYITEAGCVCAVGAIRTAAAERAGVQDMSDVCVALPVEISDAARRAELLADAHINDPFCGLVGWNDNKGRTADEVVAVLRAAAEEAE